MTVRPDTSTAGTAPVAADHAAPTDSPAARLQSVDHLEWWVGNAKAFTRFLSALFGFEPVAYAGPETGRRDRVSHVFAQGDIRFVVSGALSPDSPIAEHVRLHGDGVHDVCFRVDDAERTYNLARDRGARDARGIQVEEDSGGVIRHAAIKTYGETIHTLLDRSAYHGAFAPGYVATPATNGAATSRSADPVGLTHIDHVVGNVERGRLAGWVSYYETALGFEQFLHFTQDQIATEFSALESTVMWNQGKVVLPINEPADGRRKSQIEEYLDYYGAPGVQHIALHTPDIVTAVSAMRRRGVEFLTVPPEYYDDAKARLEGVDLEWDALTELGILVDRDEQGHLLQIFTQPLCDRPTVFFEIIQREGCEGFGEGNFKALFEAIERAQAERGNL